MCGFGIGGCVTTTIALDDDLVSKAGLLTGLHENSALLREALKALIERENTRRLALVGGNLPGQVPLMRRRPVAMATDDFG
jgi:Arc/MetJ family transcription regulator